MKQYLICFILFLYFNSIFNKGSSFVTVALRTIKQAKKKCVHQSQLKRAFVSRCLTDEVSKQQQEQQRIDKFFEYAKQKKEIKNRPIVRNNFQKR